MGERFGRIPSLCETAGEGLVAVDVAGNVSPSSHQKPGRRKSENDRRPLLLITIPYYAFLFCQEDKQPSHQPRLQYPVGKRFATLRALIKRIKKKSVIRSHG
jgi:hypothetical protein